ncbi:hypothetical protein PTTG_30084 [Puccinia triticina 1-1 BBBD Race 1]|uniref:Retrotransposon Copia-like N-terminal domain-containing protein n=1 Tax=Puccinia triticina (isolate 1-1 / race 1 (BBBD)) TaxID=630390 RepID=A0A180G074_PUCT1|nr:hypothetical protein PTTG_30084 [Puccinia triticina 1-1 BBBD Race 1]
MANTRTQNPSSSTDKSTTSSSAKNNAYSPDKNHVNVPKFDGSNFPLWERKIKMHLRPRRLKTYIEEPMLKEPDDEETQGALRTCSILSKAMSNVIFTSVINDDNKKDPFAIWTEIKTIYASDSLLLVFQVWNKWLDIQYKKDMNSYITEIEESLANFSSLGLKVPEVLIGCGIVGRITKRQPMLMQALFADLKALAKPKEIIAKLRDIGRHETATKQKFVEESEPTLTALATGTIRRPKKQPSTGPVIRCSHGKHNPRATTHTKETCWTIHPTTRPPD